MRQYLISLLVAVSIAAPASPAQSPSPAVHDPWQPFAFLIGTWEAETGGGTAAAKVIGLYSFAPELNNHILARRSGNANCKAPASFDCEHSDLLYLYPQGPSIKAIYFDNEGHVIHYDVTTPTATSAIFLSDSATPGPQFRLVYERKDSILSGKFQMRMPGQSEFNSYLEWSGSKK
jgi:hypothetical protein